MESEEKKLSTFIRRSERGQSELARTLPSREEGLTKERVHANLFAMPSDKEEAKRKRRQNERSEVNFQLSTKNLRIIFLGTPEFAVPSLRALVGAGYNVVAVVTAPDRPAGRGLALRESEVKSAARELGFEVPDAAGRIPEASRGPILQPEKLRDEAFLSALRALEPDLGIVIAFRMLPEAVWAMPRLGTFNLHASLLPQYRGAAPINWAIINGERTTGVTTFLLNHEIDRGAILEQVSEEIRPQDTAGTLYERLMTIGAGLVLETVQKVISDKWEVISATPQNEEVALKPAPKIFKEDCRIDWSWDGRRIIDFVRGLSPYPAAWMELKGTTAKVFEAVESGSDEASESRDRLRAMPSRKEEGRWPKCKVQSDIACGTVDTDGKTCLRVRCADGWIQLLDLQIAGKKRMPVGELLKGFKL